MPLIFSFQDLSASGQSRGQCSAVPPNRAFVRVMVIGLVKVRAEANLSQTKRNRDGDFSTFTVAPGPILVNRLTAIMRPRVSTPPAGGATVSQSHSLQSTPYIRGSGSNYSHRSQHGQDDYKPYLREDLTHQYKTSFNEFLDYILCYGRSLDNANPSQNHDIISDNRFKTLLSKYREPIYQETDRYFPFVELANHVIDQLNIDPDLDPNSRIRFCRNDPVTIRGSHAIKKPEVIVVLNKSLEVPERGNVDNLMRHGPLEKQAGFWWTELLAFFEFKRVEIEKSLEQQDAVTGDDCSSTFLPILSFTKHL